MNRVVATFHFFYFIVFYLDMENLCRSMVGPHKTTEAEQGQVGWAQCHNHNVWSWNEKNRLGKCVKTRIKSKERDTNSVRKYVKEENIRI